MTERHLGRKGERNFKHDLKVYFFRPHRSTISWCPKTNASNPPGYPQASLGDRSLRHRGSESPQRYASKRKQEHKEEMTDNRGYVPPIKVFKNREKSWGVSFFELGREHSVTFERKCCECWERNAEVMTTEELEPWYIIRRQQQTNKREGRR